MCVSKVVPDRDMCFLVEVISEQMQRGDQNNSITKTENNDSSNVPDKQ